MPANPRIRGNNIFGSVEDNPLSVGATLINSAGLSNLDAVITKHAVVTLDPLRQFGAPEIIVVNTHTASAPVATVLRGQYGTAAREHPQGTLWVHAPINEDFTSIVTSGTRPSDPYTGQMIYETDTNKFVARSSTGSWIDAIPLGAWQTWTPVITQGVAVSSTVLTARYSKMGRRVDAHMRVNITSAGTVSQSVTSSLPVPAFAHGGSGIPVGSGWIYDASTSTMYEGSWGMLSAGLTVDMASDATAGNDWGVSPAVALASGDIISFHLTYESAS